MIEIWTDGSCARNPGGAGGWAAIVTRDGEKVRELSGGHPSTTNNRMEMEAVIRGLLSVTRTEFPEEPVCVVSDSTYVIKGATDWMYKWQVRGWRKGPRSVEAVLNVDLWQKIWIEVKRLGPTFRWVKGHNGSVLNERCDELAAAAAILAAAQLDPIG